MQLAEGSSHAPLPTEVQAEFSRLYHGDDEIGGQMMRPDFGGHFRSLETMD